MGLCGSSDNLTPEQKARRKDESRLNKQVENVITKSQVDDQQVVKLLLLGAGESGKSTLFKQMITIYGKGYPESERRLFTPVVYNNIITAMKTLVLQASNYGGVSFLNMSSAKTVENLRGDEVIDQSLGSTLQKLWSDNGILKAYDNKSSFQLFDSAKYFFDRLSVIMKEDFVPNEQDVLRCRVRTTGIVENDFVIDGNQFKMIDVGGQRNERKKWIHCFEKVTAVIFVAAISEYDQVLYEDESTNRVIEALNLFQEICNSRWFRETAMILFLNKCDLFAEKIPKIPLSDYFSEYKGGQNYDDAVEFMKELFESRCRNPEKQIYTYVTCATDTQNVHMVFNAVKDIIIRRSLNEAGLV